MNTPSNDNPLDSPATSSYAGDDYANLVQYGLTEAVQAQFIAIREKDSELVPGRVARVDGISTFVHGNSSDYRAVSAFARIGYGDELEPAQPTVGDWVLVRLGENQDPDEIELVLTRSSLLVRKRVQRGKE